MNDIIIRSPDTDVFVLVLHFAQNIEQRVLFDTGVGNRRRLIDIHLVIDETGMDLCSALPALHVQWERFHQLIHQKGQENSNENNRATS